MKDFFNCKYIEIFKKYYYTEEPLKKIVYNKQIINLSNKTKSIYYLLEKNDSQREEIKETIIQNYFNIKTGYFGQDPFISKKKKLTNQMNYI